MKGLSFCFILWFGLISLSAFPHRMDELDRVFVYLNDNLVGTWRADESGVVHIDSIKEGDKLVFKARTDLGGLGNSSIDVKDDNGLTIENIQSPSSSNGAADFEYVFSLKKIDTAKVLSLQVFLNVDPARNLPPPTVAIIMIPKK
jgi:hypothetical protein